MDSGKIVGVLLFIVVALATILLQILKVIDILASITDIWIWIAAAAIGVSFNLLTKTRKGEKEQREQEPYHDPRFANLMICYSRRDDTPDTPIPARPRYVVNSQTNQAYWVSDLLEPYIRQHKIGWYSFNDEKELRNHFQKHGIVTNDIPQKQPEDLGLHLRRDGLLEFVDLDLERLLKRLDGRKIDGVTIFKLYPWHYYYRKKPFYTNKRLLLKHSTHEVFVAPFHDLELIDRGLIDSDNKCRRPFESLRRWSKRMKYTYMDRRYSEAELLVQNL